MLGNRVISISGGAGRSPARMVFGAVGTSTLPNNDAASGIGRVHPALRAMWNSVPNVTAVALSTLKLAHWVSISRSPGYFFSLWIDHCCQRWNPWSSCSVWVPAQCSAIPMLIHSSRGQSGVMHSIALLISSQDASTPSLVRICRTLSFSSISCHRSSSGWGIVGRRIQLPFPAHRYGCLVSGWMLGGSTSCTVNPLAVAHRSS